MKLSHRLLGSLIASCIGLTPNRGIAASIPSQPLVLSSAGSLNSSDGADSISFNGTFSAIDRHFSFIPVFSGVKIPAVPCLLNSINVALQLALEDFEGFMFETVFRLDSHPQVQIAVVPDKVGESIPRKFAVWGISVGIGVSHELRQSFLAHRCDQQKIFRQFKPVVNFIRKPFA